VRIVRARHPLQGRSLALLGWMRRRGSLDLLLVLPDGSRALIPAAWTELEPPRRPARAGTLGSLDDLLARVLAPLLERVVLAGGDDLRRESEDAARPRSVEGPGARGGAVGAAGRGAPPSGDDAVERAGRAGRNGAGGGGAR
jgi:hypothetical protein